MAMADKTGLKALGFTYGAVTAVVMFMAGFVVLTQADDTRSLAEGAPVVAETADLSSAARTTALR
jgi:hypothetical protein